MKKNTIIAVALAVVMACCACAFVGCGGDKTDNNGGTSIVTPEQKTVKSIAVDTMPTKTEYTVGEDFSLAGGKISVTYSDNSTEVIDMTADGVTFNKPNMTTAAQKNITVTYSGKKVTFKISVVTARYTFTLDLNYAGAPSAQTQTVSRGASAQKPVAPTRDGYTFVDWYANKDYTHVYDFSGVVIADTAVYAMWKKDGVTYVDVTFDYDYYGKKLVKYNVPTESGTAVVKPTVDPVRDGYTFNGWVTTAGGDTAFDFTKNITESTTVYASWTRKTSGAQKYVFEAEDTDLTGKVGPGSSGTAQEEGMIVLNEASGASNKRFVSYLYQKDLSIEFYIASDIDVAGATLTMRVAAEIADFELKSDEFQVLVNSTPISYQSVSLARKNGGLGDFAEVTMIVSLKAGENLVKVKVNNNREVPQSTYKAIAPVLDNISITADAVLTWDENYGLPKSNYMD